MCSTVELASSFGSVAGEVGDGRCPRMPSAKLMSFGPALFGVCVSRSKPPRW
jgi:hypothetical protein